MSTPTRYGMLALFLMFVLEPGIPYCYPVPGTALVEPGLNEQHADILLSKRAGSWACWWPRAQTKYLQEAIPDNSLSIADNFASSLRRTYA